MAIGLRAKPKKEPPAMPPPTAAELLEAKKDELLKLRKQEALLLAARLETERSRTSSQRDVDVIVEARKATHKVELAQVETELLAAEAKRERAESAKAKTDWESAQRRRCLSLIALRAANREISELRKQGASGPCDLVMVPGGFAVYEDVLLGSQSRVGINGRLGRGFLQEAFNAGLITRAELAEDD